MARARKARPKKRAAGKPRAPRGFVSVTSRKGKATIAKLQRELEQEKRKRAEAERRAKLKPKPKLKKRKKREPAQSQIQTTKAKIGKTTHISAKEPEGEPQYTWKELEERAAPMLVARKKKAKRWARLIVEMSPGSLLRPEEYRRLRGKPVLRSLWHPAEELMGKAVDIVDQLQRSEAVTPRMKIVIVESKKRPPRRLF